jgi:hypothetical protein
VKAGSPSWYVASKWIIFGADEVMSVLYPTLRVRRRRAQASAGPDVHRAALDRLDAAVLESCSSEMGLPFDTAWLALGRQPTNSTPGLLGWLQAQEDGE